MRSSILVIALLTGFFGGESPIWARTTILRSVVDGCFALLQGAPQSVLSKQEVLRSQLDLSAFQKSVLEYIQEIRAQSSRLRRKNRAERIILRSPFVKKTLAVMMTKLENRLTATSVDGRVTDPRLLRSFSVVIEKTRLILEKFDEEGISYLHFLKLGYVYSFQFGFLVDDKEKRESAVKAQDSTEFYISEDNFKKPIPRGVRASKIITDQQHLMEHLNSSDFVFEFTLNVSKMDCWTWRWNLEDFDRSRGPFVLIPTYANLGFESILWASSLEAGFVGLSDTPQLVDNQTMSPIQYFAHDLAHNKAVAALTADPRLWRSYLQSSRSLRTSDPRLFKIRMAILFFMFHEKTSEMKCGAVRSYFKYAVAPDWLDEELWPRLINREDLGLAFTPDYPSFAEFAEQYRSLRRTLAEICK